MREGITHTNYDYEEYSRSYLLPHTTYQQNKMPASGLGPIYSAVCGSWSWELELEDVQCADMTIGKPTFVIFLSFFWVVLEVRMGSLVVGEEKYSFSKNNFDY